MERVNSISTFICAYDIIENYLDDNYKKSNDGEITIFGESMSDDDVCFLEHFDDFEGYTYYVINSESVVVVLDDGTTCGQFDSMPEFWGTVHALLIEDRENR